MYAHQNCAIRINPALPCSHTHQINNRKRMFLARWSSFSQCPVGDIKNIYLFPASRTSTHSMMRICQHKSDSGRHSVHRQRRYMKMSARDSQLPPVKWKKYVLSKGSSAGLCWFTLFTVQPPEIIKRQRLYRVILTVWRLELDESVSAGMLH